MINLTFSTLIFSIICFCLLVQPMEAKESSEESVRTAMAQIPEPDLLDIKNLFEALFKFEELGFALLGDKPISFCFLDVKPTRFLLSDNSTPPYSRGIETIWKTETILYVTKNYYREWSTWKKYRHLFDIQNYIFLDSFGVLLINKKRLKTTINENDRKFRQILGSNFDVDLFIEDISNGQDPFLLLRKNHELLGIILGFGKHNSYLFQRRHEISGEVDLHEIPLNGRRPILPSSGFETIQEELDVLEKLLRNNDDCWLFYFPIVNFNRVSFVSDPNHPESIFLKSKYETQRKAINRLFLEEDWFEQILFQLTQ